VRVRRASIDDGAALADLLGQLGYPTTEEEARARLAAWAGDERRLVLVAERSAVAVGFVAVAAVPYFERAGSWARICALAVDRDHRRRGVGRRLVAVAEEAAAGWGCVAVEITSSRRRDEAHAFYRDLGYEDRCGRSAMYRRELEVASTGPGSAAARW
jgi:GNAT superfamily N-acetyltransferase